MWLLRELLRAKGIAELRVGGGSSSDVEAACAKGGCSMGAE